MPFDRITTTGPDRVFLPLAAAVGILFVFLTPPFHIPDEPAHFFRGYAVSEGVAYAVDRNGDAGAVLPASIPAMAARLLGPTFDARRQRVAPADVIREFRTPLEAERVVFLPVPPLRTPTPIGFGAVAYPPFLYLPQAGLIAVGRFLDLPPLILLYLARLANLLTGLRLLHIGLRWAPFSRWTALVIALFPMSVVLRSSASTDALLIPLIFVFMSGVFRAHADRSLPSAAAAASLTAAAFLMGAGRPPYAVFALAVMLVRARQGQSKRTWGFRLLVLGSAAAGVATALRWIAGLAAPKVPANTTLDSSARLKHVVDAPLEFISETWHYVGAHLGDYVREIVGNLGWLDHPLPIWIPPVVAGGTVLVAMLDGPAVQRLSAAARLWVAIACIGVAAGLFLALHLGTPLEGEFVEGLQGRYFIPALWPLLVAVALGHRNGESAAAAVPFAAWSIIALGLLGAFATTLGFYTA
ncbi:MAG: DUF2142 domain-containing protein [Thermoanaerobaculia bacterium]